MELSLLLLAVVIIILQVITISLVSSNKKQTRDSKGLKRPAGAPSASKAERKDADPRRRSGGAGNKKSGENKGSRPSQQQQQGRPQQSPPAAAAIDPMEKSLRDINLRLKSAEREQENVRKKIQDNGNGSKESRAQESRPHDGGRPQQRERGPQYGGKPERQPRREFNRDAPPRENRPERPEPQNYENSEAPRSAGPGFHESPQFEDRPRRPRPELADHPTPQAPETPPVNHGAPEDNLQHGRKFTAKRRQLPENTGNGEEPENAPNKDVLATAAVNENTAAPETPQTGEHYETAEIQFGRGRR